MEREEGSWVEKGSHMPPCHLLRDPHGAILRVPELLTAGFFLWVSAPSPWQDLHDCVPDNPQALLALLPTPLRGTAFTPGSPSPCGREEKATSSAMKSSLLLPVGLDVKSAVHTWRSNVGTRFGFLSTPAARSHCQVPLPEVLFDEQHPRVQGGRGARAVEAAACTSHGRWLLGA